ncbi:MAG TPA: PIN/TRAM domain-containing protein [Virgibacillus sp.]|nr:PIN/TRAM domain-containing protein [Virgibacillus sp.]
MKKIVHLLFIVIGGTVGFLYGPGFIRLLNITEAGWVTSSYFGSALGAIILFLISYLLVDNIVDFLRWIEDGLIKVPVGDLFFGSLGLVLGLLIAYFINLPIQEINLKIVSQVVPLFLTVLLGYLGFQVGFRRREEFTNLVNLNRKEKFKQELVEEDAGKKAFRSKPKVLDTSVIIDGRIADICQTKFLEGPIVIPQFVLGELQHIADSSDVLKRNRGRRGLDILNRIQKELPVEVEIYEGDFEDIPEVDSKLIKLAKVLDGILVTNDFNLNKVSDFQGVTVLNINDLANAVKPVVLPGEELVVQVIKDGKEQKQGIAYLDDGTMIVVEEGRDYIGKTIEVLITSVLQTSAGRMIFAKPKLLEKAQ